MKKFSALLWLQIIVFTLILSPACPAKIRFENPIQNFVKEEIMKQAGTMLGREIRIGAIGGNFINSVTIDDIRVARGKKLSDGEVIRIKKAKIYYNVFKLVAIKDLIPCIGRIELEEPDVLVEHLKDGSINLANLIAAGSEETTAAPPPFRAKVFIKNGKARFVDHIGFFPEHISKTFEIDLEKINAVLNLSKKDRFIFKCDAVSGGSTLKADGNVNLLTTKSKISVVAKNIDIKKWNSYLRIPVMKDLDVGGIADVSLSTSTPPNYFLKADIFVANGTIIGRPVNGALSIALNEDKFSLTIKNSAVCGGRSSGSITCSLSQKNPSLNGRIDFAGLDAAQFSSNMPGVSGNATGTLIMSGTLNKTDISLDAGLSNGYILGQSADKILSSASLSDGNVFLNSLELSSGQSKFLASGSLRKDLSFSLNASAKGFELKNPDLWGGIYGNLSEFSGSISGSLNKEFFKNPIKNLEAKGHAKISNASIGKQKITSAEGELVLANGLFETEGFELSAGKSKMLLKGRLGFDREGDLTVKGKDLSLSDFKILNEFLPESAKGVTGVCNVDVKFKGFFSSGTNIKELLKSLSTDCNVQINNASLAGEKIDGVSLVLKLDKGDFSVESSIKAGESNANIRAKLDKDGSLSGNFYMDADLLRLSPFTQKFAKISGHVHLDGTVSGDISNPVLAARSSGKDISYNKIFFDKAGGNIKFEDGFLYLYGPYKVSLYGEEYSFSSKIGLLTDTPYIEGHLLTRYGGLKSLFAITNGAYSELTKLNISGVESQKSIRVYQNAVKLPNIGRYKNNNMLRLVGTNNGFLKAWGKIKDSEKSNEVPELVKFSGEGALGIKADLTIDNKKINAEVAIKAGQSKIGKFKFDEMALVGSYKKDTLNIDNFYVKKSSGILKAFGNVPLKGAMNVRIYSKDFRVDGIDSLANMNGMLEGSVSLASSINGAFSSPNVSTSFSLKDASIGGFSFDEMSGEAAYSGNALKLSKIELQNNKQKAFLKGVIPFTKDKDISLKASFDGGNIGILFSLIKGVKWSSGNGKADISVGGNIDSPKIDGELSLKDAVIDIDGIKSTVYNLNTKITARDSGIYVENLSGRISGQRTLNTSDPFSVTGFIDYKKAFGASRQIDLNILSADTYGSIDIPGIYTGDFEISDTHLNGSFPLYKSNASILVSSNINLHDGIIQLPKQDGKINVPLPFALAIKLNIGKNSRLLQEDSSAPLSLDITRMNLELTGQDLEISGNASSPSIVGDVIVKSGSVNVLGREFEILSESDQENYFGLDRSMIIKNEAVFSGGKGDLGAIPAVYITAKSDVMTNAQSGNTQIDAAQISTVNEKVTIITRISGSLSQKDKFRPIQLKFFAFTKDPTNGKMALRVYDENQLKVMILPDFVKDSLGLSSSGSGVDTNAILVDYASSRLESVILRGVTSKVEKALGLESLTLDYNFGRDLEKIMPTRRGEYAANDKPQFGVGFVKGFFDKVYIQLRYAQAGSQAVQSNTSLNYEIMWKMDKRWSIAYYREPVSFTDPNSTYYKMTLQSVYQF